MSTPSDDNMDDDMDDKDREGWDRVRQGVTAVAFQPLKDIEGMRNHAFEAFVQRHHDLETFEAEPRGTAAPAEEDAEGWDLARQEAVAALQQKVEAGFVTTQALAPPQSGESDTHEKPPPQAGNAGLRAPPQDSATATA
jgi:hypothetical protein